MEMVAVEWLDSTAYDGWLQAEKTDFKSHAIHTVGLLVHEDAAVLVVSTSYDADAERFMDPLAIPKCAIVKQESVKIIRLKK